MGAQLVRPLAAQSWMVAAPRKAPVSQRPPASSKASRTTAATS